MLTTLLFSIVKYKNESGDILHNDRLSISKWACNWKMLFNLDPIKPAQNVLFSRKDKVQIHATITANNIEVKERPIKNT